MNSILKNSWNIIGFLILIGLALFIVYTIVLHTHRKSRDWYRYFRTKDIPPAKGQLWQSAAGKSYYIVAADANGIQLNSVHPYHYASGGSSWIDAPDRWRQIKKDRRIHLVGNWEK